MYKNIKYYIFLFLIATLFSSTYEINILLDDYSGLFQGSKVLSNGEKIGKIKLIEENNDGKWLITLKIYEEYENINSDMLFKIEGSNLLIDYTAMDLREQKKEEQRLAKIKAEEEAAAEAERVRLEKIKAEEDNLIKEKFNIKNIRHFYFYFGTHSHEFKNQTFQDNLGNLLDIENKGLNMPISYGFTGNTYNRFPFNFKYDFNYSKTPYNLLDEISFDIQDEDLDYNFGWEEDQVVFNEYDKVNFSLSSISSSISFDLLPNFFIRPFFGVGYSYNTLDFHASTTHSGETDFHFHREQNFSNLFIVSNLIYKTKGHIYFDLSYRFSLIEKELKWDDIQFNIGFGT